MKNSFTSWEEMAQSKILSLDRLLERLHSQRKAGATIATLNGSFDLLHAGHLYILFEASKTADILVVAVNTDASVKRYKSPKRPIIPLQYRMEMLSALSFIDFITWFDEDDPRVLLNKIKPDVHVNGAEYTENCIEAETVRQNGGRLSLVPRIPGLATSQILSTIKNLCDE